LAALTPFIKKFRSFTGRNYIYNVNTNSILEVTKILYDIIDNYKSILSAKSKYSKYYSIFEIENLVKEIAEVSREKGLFSPHKPRRMVVPFNGKRELEILLKDIKHMTLLLSENCNMRCEYCIHSGLYFYERPHRNVFMSLETAMKAVNFFMMSSDI